MRSPAEKEKLEFLDLDIAAEINPFVITKPVQHESEHGIVERVVNPCITEAPAQLQSENGAITLTNPIGQIHSLSEVWETDTKSNIIKALIQMQSSNHDIETDGVKPYISTCLVQSKNALWNDGRYDNYSIMTSPPLKVIPLAQLQSENGNITITDTLAQLHSLSEDLKTDTKYLPKRQTLDQDIDAGDVKPYITRCLVQSNCELGNREVNVKPYTTESPAQFQSDNVNITTTNPVAQLHSLTEDLKTDTKHLPKEQTLDQDIDAGNVNPCNVKSLVQSNGELWNREGNVKPYTNRSHSQLQIDNLDITITNSLVQLHSTDVDLKTDIKPLARVYSTDQVIEVKEVEHYITETLVLANIAVMDHDVDVKVYKTESPAHVQSENMDITTMNPVGQLHILDGDLKLNTKPQKQVQNLYEDIDVKPCPTKSLVGCVEELAFKVLGLDSNKKYESEMICKEIVWETPSSEYHSMNSTSVFAPHGNLLNEDDLDLLGHHLEHESLDKTSNESNFQNVQYNIKNLDNCLDKTKHSPLKIYTCNESGNTVIQNIGLSRYLSGHTSKNSELCSCEECDKFSHSGQLTGHLLIHSGESTYNCEECGKKFKQKSNMTSHLLIHSGEKLYSCDECGKKFKQRGKLTSHLYIHSGEKQYSCNECGKKFLRKGDVTSHLLTHSEEKPYSCDECGKKFKQRGELTSHLFIHSGEKPNSCNECGKKFLRKGDVTSHFITHSEEKPYSCDECGKKFKQKGKLTSHLFIHSGEKLYSCNECGKRFTERGNLTRHLIIHSGEKPYSCEKCGKNFMQRGELTSHLFIHSGEQPYSCEECGKTFTRKGQLTDHLLNHSGKKPYSCDECGKKFTRRGHLTRHLLIHSGEKPYSCEECGKKFTRRGRLTSHLLIHSGEKPYSCEKCGKKFKQRRHLTSHLLIHSGEKPYSCDECGKKFTHRSYMISHLLTHSGEKPYSCDECGKKFTRKGEMIPHLLIHLGEKPYSCDECGKKFTQRGRLTSHLLIHSGEKPYSCEECREKFSQKCQLTSHLLIHSGEKPYGCEECSKKFTQRGKLTSHLLIHSGEKPYGCEKCGKKFKQRRQLTSHLLIHSRNRTVVMKAGRNLREEVI